MGLGGERGRSSAACDSRKRKADQGGRLHDGRDALRTEQGSGANVHVLEVIQNRASHKPSRGEGRCLAICVPRHTPQRGRSGGSLSCDLPLKSNPSPIQEYRRREIVDTACFVYDQPQGRGVLVTTTLPWLAYASIKRKVAAKITKTSRLGFLRLLLWLWRAKYLWLRANAHPCRSVGFGAPQAPPQAGAPSGRRVGPALSLPARASAGATPAEARERGLPRERWVLDAGLALGVGLWRASGGRLAGAGATRRVGPAPGNGSPAGEPGNGVAAQLPPVSRVRFYFQLRERHAAGVAYCWWVWWTMQPPCVKPQAWQGWRMVCRVANTLHRAVHNTHLGALLGVLGALNGGGDGWVAPRQAGLWGAAAGGIGTWLLRGFLCD